MTSTHQSNLTDAMSAIRGEIRDMGNTQATLDGKVTTLDNQLDDLSNTHQANVRNNNERVSSLEAELRAALGELKVSLS